MQIVARYAELLTENGPRHGIALRGAAGEVAFLDDILGTWTTLTNADMPMMTLLGACDIADAQAAMDGAGAERIRRILTKHQEHPRHRAAA